MHLFITLLLALPLFLSAQTAVADRPIRDPEVKQFADAAYTAGLKDIFEGTGPFTTFAPTNEAFEKFGKSRLEELKRPENRDTFVDLIIYHVVPGKYMAENLKNMDLPTINGKELHVRVENGEIRVNNARVVKTNRVGPNGVMHQIDTVLEP